MSENRKYWVPALEKADGILSVLAKEPDKHKLIDLSRRLGINKSSMFSLLATMEALNWVRKSAADTYSLGPAVSAYASSYAQHFELYDAFQHEAAPVRDKLQETIQLARREGDHILYLGKMEAQTPVRLLSEPGMRLPAHATALGKSLLAWLPEKEWSRLYPKPELTAMTPNTIARREALFEELRRIRGQGYAVDDQESVIGFRCVAAPVFNRAGEAAAAVSCSMPLHQWERKADEARAELIGLARRMTELH
ncbi:IclR family transcriptional regulator [Paenibacillus humicola]|uniref:IclR family transcriptional regulator n=1 Tax=Paenibacillus humicola TaxID=3110540 RepID=UPI00237ACBC8|nr:IclR family transcriptional regulator [Paenibacillus humicola]